MGRYAFHSFVFALLLFTAAEESSSLLLKQLAQQRDQLVDTITNSTTTGRTTLTPELISSSKVNRVSPANMLDGTIRAYASSNADTSVTSMSQSVCILLQTAGGQSAYQGRFASGSDNCSGSGRLSDADAHHCAASIATISSYKGSRHSSSGRQWCFDCISTIGWHASWAQPTLEPDLYQQLDVMHQHRTGKKGCSRGTSDCLWHCWPGYRYCLAWQPGRAGVWVASRCEQAAAAALQQQQASAAFKTHYQ